MNDFTVLVLPGSYASSVAVTLALLEAASMLAPPMQLARPRWRVVSVGGSSVPLSSGMHVEATPLPQRPRAEGSCWIVPGLNLASLETLQRRLADDDMQRAARALAAHAGRGGAVAASCSAVFLLQAAGLLAGRTVTTSWWLAPALRSLEPGCTVDADRMVCEDGPLSTAGAAFAQTDLMLHLLRRRFGVAMAEAVGRNLLIDGRQAQGAFVVPAMLASGHALIARLVRRIEAALPHPPSVEELAQEFAMSTRTLSRHVRQATGKSTMALLQSVRSNRARMLIESSRMTLEQVAAQVGYEDATALRRLMRKVAGGNPSRYRPAGGPPLPP
ncbi:MULTISPECIES: helix-turn-helix domain-containing protein [unclassified Variovorax]|uniref:GlxA family transcriptional regulator n=1 Tax=unclassified Variovorax TaxID=663243 RepID=UPI002574ED68|nr:MULTISPECIES: helix-turn-helix domain-containing protein [unclassified Variovorax]MDM0090841.1 helix-turn-helix domain-containing protein [Variovorax sp. J22G40]MDM0149157.1 helix-turn-helix domain-containing protein [Variovorax sp. J2P1-31]